MNLVAPKEVQISPSTPTSVLVSQLSSVLGRGGSRKRGRSLERGVFAFSGEQIE